MPQPPLLCCHEYLSFDIEAIKAMMRLSFPLFFSLLAAGCCPIQGPNACTDSAHWDIYKANLRVEDYGLLDGQTDKARLRDWKECGGAQDGSYDIDEKARTHEQYWRESIALFNRIRHCMEQKNYRFIGQCDSELKRAYPSCGMAGLTGGTLEAITTSKANLLRARLSHHAAVLK